MNTKPRSLALAATLAIVLLAAGAAASERGGHQYERKTDDAVLTVAEKLTHPTRYYPNLRYEPEFYLELPTIERAGWAAFIGDAPEDAYDVGVPGWAAPIEMVHVLARDPIRYVQAHIMVHHDPGGSAFAFSAPTVLRPDEVGYFAYGMRFFLQWRWGSGNSYRFARLRWTMAHELQLRWPQWPGLEWKHHMSSSVATSAVEAIYMFLELDSGLAKFCDDVLLHLQEDLTVAVSGSACRYFPQEF